MEGWLLYRGIGVGGEARCGMAPLVKGGSWPFRYVSSLSRRRWVVVAVKSCFGEMSDVPDETKVVETSWVRCREWPRWTESLKEVAVSNADCGDVTRRLTDGNANPIYGIACKRWLRRSMGEALPAVLVHVP